MHAANREAVDRLWDELLRPDGDLNKVPMIEEAVFIGPMVEHLDREELIHFLHHNFMSALPAPINILERSDGERFSTVSYITNRPDRPVTNDVTHFIAEVSSGEVVAIRMAFNVHRWPREVTERIFQAAVDWRAAR